MKRLVSNDRAKWLFTIGIIAIGVGLTAKNVISYPTECQPQEITHHYERTKQLLTSS